MAQRWMRKMGYQQMKKPSGRYVYGHKRTNVVYYHQTVLCGVDRAG
jgi:hypothetical protein